ncbi:MAG TPA: AMIN domain-containing protein, partial [Thermoanaerobaculia bacterium]|nr:AMIN domain-containing protein [Thermoanaerobaculia bacterium]
MTGARRYLLVAGMLALSVSSASASIWHRKAKQPEQPATAAAAMTLNAIEVTSTATPQIILKTSGAPAFTSLNPTPDAFIVDLSGTTKAAGLEVPSHLPSGVASISADEVTEMGSKFTRVTIKLSQTGAPQASADGNSIVIAMPAAAPAPAAVAETQAPVATTTPIVEVSKPEPVADDKPLAKAKALKKIEMSGSDVIIATDGNASYSAFKLANPARVVIDLAGIKDKTTKHAIDVNDSIVKRVRAGQFKPDVARVVIDLSEAMAYNVTKSGDKLRVSFGEQRATTSESVATPVPTKVAEKVVDKPAASADQIPVVADNAAWKMPQQASSGATAVINAADQVPPPPSPTAPTVNSSQTISPPQTQPSTPGENVFQDTTTSATGRTETPLGGSRQLSAGQKVFTGEPISLNLKDADIKDVLRTFSQLTGLNIAVDPNVTGSVTVDFTDVPWDQALDLILRQNKLSYQLEGNIMRVGTLASLAEEAAANRRLAEEERLNVPLTTVSFKLSYAKAGDVSALLKDIASPRARIIVDARTNQLIISEIPAYLQTMRNLIESVDVANRQVVIEARIVQTRKTFVQQWGFNWGFHGTLDPALGT